MKTKSLLLIDGDSDSAVALALAAGRSGREIVRAFSSHEAFCILEHGMDELDAIVIDLEAGVHGMTVLEEIEITPATPPLIVLTDPNEPCTMGIAAVRGAALCLAKPVTATQLAAAVKQVCDPARQVAAHSCDAWGHLRFEAHAPFAGPGAHHLKMRPVTALERANV